MPRQRMYSSNAERQAAYRARLARRQADDLDAGLVARVTELETALAAATSRARAAEDRAAVAEGQMTALKLTVAALQHRLEQTVPPVGPEPAKMNRQARRQTERDARRHRH